MYAKIFRQIFDSSIAEKPEVRFTFMDMLVLADSDGVVDMTHEAIARTTNRPLKDIRRTIAELEAPDPHSRNNDHDGRRLKKLDEHRNWGWVILNYDHYREVATDQQRRATTRERVRRHRENRRKQTEKPACNAPVTPCNVGVTPLYASASVSVSQKEEGGAGETLSLFHQLKAELWRYFKRQDNERLTYEDESLLAEIARDQTCLDQWNTIRCSQHAFKRQSLTALLQNWGNELDKARNYQPPPLKDRNGNPIKQTNMLMPKMSKVEREGM